jgi:hypothetical protein
MTTTDRLHVVLHVPKCAGRTMENHLAKHLGSRFWSPEKRDRELPLELYSRKYDDNPPVPTRDIAAISGHYLGQSIEQLFPGRQIVRSVVLREPERFFLSLYNFRMMRYLAAGQSAYPFRLFMQSLPVDPVSYFLLDTWLENSWVQIASLTASQKASLLDEMLAGFDRVVDIAEADDLIGWHSRDLGIPEQAVRTNTEEEWSQKTGWTPLKLWDLTPSERETLAGRLNLDRYIWRRWALKKPVRFESATVASFLRHELPRPVAQVRRRLARRLMRTSG